MKAIDIIFFILLSILIWGLFINNTYQLKATNKLGETWAAMDILEAAKEKSLDLENALDIEVLKNVSFKNKNGMVTSSVHGLIQFGGYILLQLLLIIWIVIRIYVQKKKST